MKVWVFLLFLLINLTACEEKVTLEEYNALLDKKIELEEELDKYKEDRLRLIEIITEYEDELEDCRSELDDCQTYLLFRD